MIHGFTETVWLCFCEKDFWKPLISGWFVIAPQFHR
jgi:hypothetical protein